MDKFMTDKTEQRKTLLTIRNAVTVEQHGKWNAALCSHLLAWLQQSPVASVGVYLPIRGEPDLMPAYRALVDSGLALALPVVRERNAALVFVPWIPGQELTRDACGIPVPPQQEQTVSPAVLLLPCVGFNRAGFRLGYGAGYYDRTLALPPRPVTVGIAYANARADFDADVHDIALDMIFTEQGLASRN